MRSFVTPEEESVEAIADSVVATLRRLAAGIGAREWRASTERVGLATSTRWDSVPAGAGVDLSRDEGLRCTWLTVRAEPPELENLLFEVLLAALPVVPVDALLAAAQGEGDPTALPRLALGCQGQAVEEVIRAIDAGLASPRLERRRAAVMAIGLLLWSEFATPVEAAIDQEPDEDLRHALMFAYQEIMRQGPRE